MAFNQINFAPVGGNTTNTPGIYTYSSDDDTISAVESAGYFDAKQFQLRVGDEIYAHCSDGSATFVWNGVGLACTILAQVGSGGMPAAPNDGNFHLGQNTTWFEASTSIKSNRIIVVRGTDTTDQEPSATDTPLQVTWGPAVGTGSDPVNIDANGNIFINEADNYHFRISLQYGRTGSGGTAWIYLRFLVNGVQAGVTVLSKLNNANSDFPYQAELTADLPAGVTITGEIWRGSEGTNDGGLFANTPVLAGAAVNPSADIIISRYVVENA